MSQFIQVPPERLADEVLRALLEEFASRDGTDYGAREFTLDEKSGRLAQQLLSGDIVLLYDTDGQEWDLLPRDEAALLLNS